MSLGRSQASPGLADTPGTSQNFSELFKRFSSDLPKTLGPIFVRKGSSVGNKKGTTKKLCGKDLPKVRVTFLVRFASKTLFLMGIDR